jgi:hypothetical protein
MKGSVAVPLLCVVAVVASPAAQADQPPFHENYEAAFRVDQFPTANPCILGGASADVIDFLDAENPISDFAFIGFGLVDVCSEPAEVIYSYSAVSDIDESAFEVSQAGDAADLNVTLDAFEAVAQTTEPVTISVHWDSPTGVARDAAAVTGTFTSPRVTVELNESIVWNDWSSLQDPGVEPPITVAGLWWCKFHGRGGNAPGCIGQVR